MITDNYRIIITTTPESVTAISEFYTNTYISNFKENFTSIVSFKYSFSPCRKKGSMNLDKFLTSSDWAPNVNISLSGDSTYLSTQAIYLISLKEQGVKLTKNDMYCYLLESVFFNMKNTDINTIINQYLIDFASSVEASLLTTFNMTLSSDDMLSIRRLGAGYLGIREGDDVKNYPAITSK